MPSIRASRGTVSAVCVWPSLCSVPGRGKVLGLRYMDTTENLRNNYLDPKDSHRSAGTRMLLEMVRLLPGSSELCHVQYSPSVLRRIFNWNIKVCIPL